MAAERIESIAAEAFALLGSGRQVTPFSTRYPDFTLAEAYQVAARLRTMRAARGESAIGRKIGFTNRAAWAGFGVGAPIWNYLFDRTVHELARAGDIFSLAGLSEPRIEPEIVLCLARAPHPQMDDSELFACIDWIAHGFEIVHSIFPGWVFTAADAVAAYGVHASLLIGERHAAGGEQAADALQSFGITLMRGGEVKARGHGYDVLGGPVQALGFLVREIAQHAPSVPLSAGEIVTTGTLTEAMAATAGDTWTTRLSGIDLGGVTLTLS